MDFEQARFNMIEQQIRPWDVLDPAVLQGLSLIRREDFVPAAQRHLAFTDTELPLGPGRSLLAPRVEARLLQELQVQPHERVLELGTGSGYVTALLAHLAGEVVTVEHDAAVQERAQAAVRRTGGHRVSWVLGSPIEGCAAQGPYDAILLNGSVAEVPAALLAQLKPGGRLLAIVGQPPMMQATLCQGQARHAVFDAVVPRLHGAMEPAAFVF